jgi:hypothetical protein
VPGPQLVTGMPLKIKKTRKKTNKVRKILFLLIP